MVMEEWQRGLMRSVANRVAGTSAGSNPASSVGRLHLNGKGPVPKTGGASHWEFDSPAFPLCDSREVRQTCRLCARVGSRRRRFKSSHSDSKRRLT